MKVEGKLREEGDGEWGAKGKNQGPGNYQSMHMYKYSTMKLISLYN